MFLPILEILAKEFQCFFFFYVITINLPNSRKREIFYNARTFIFFAFVFFT